MGFEKCHPAVNFIYFTVSFLGALFVFWKFFCTNTRIAIDAPKPVVNFALLGFGLYWLLTIVVRLLILLAYSDFYNVNDRSIQQQLAEAPTLLHFSIVLLVPITEELLYRGLVFRSVYERSPWLGYLISVVVFGALHVVGYIGSYSPVHLLLCFLEYIPAGISLCWAYEKANSIWAPILIHIAVNEIGILSMI